MLATQDFKNPILPNLKVIILVRGMGCSLAYQELTNLHLLRGKFEIAFDTFTSMKEGGGRG